MLCLTRTGTNCAVPHPAWLRMDLSFSQSLVSLGGTSTGPGPAWEGSQECRSRLGKGVPDSGRGPAVKFRLELPFVFPCLPVLPAPSLASAGSKPGPGPARTHLSCPLHGASPGQGGSGRRGSRDSVLAPARSKPSQGDGRGGAEPRAGTRVPEPREPPVPGVLRRPAGPRPGARAAWDPLPLGWARRNELGQGQRWDGGWWPPFTVYDSYSNGLPAERDGGLQATGMSLPIPSAWRPPPPARPRRPGRPGVGSPGTPRPPGGTVGPAGKQKGASWAGEPKAPRSLGSRHGAAGTCLLPLAVGSGGRHGGMGA